MNITKYLHSCLLFELDGHKLLFDPGKFSFAEGLVSVETFAKVNSIIITHIHPDHLDVDILRQITGLSGARVYTNEQVAAALAKEDIKCTVLNEDTHWIGPFKLEVFNVTHEPILDNLPPQMLGFMINDKVLHPVDSMEDALLKYEGVELLLMVTMAPFADELRITGFADQLKPKQILPVHDGYAKQFFINQRYEAYTKHFDKLSIQFHTIYKVGDSITI